MRTEMPVCNRCCFCLPLRYGLLTWGYIRLASSMLFFTGMVVAFYWILERGAAEGNDPINIAYYTTLIGFLILLTGTDLVLNIIFIVGGHKKNLKLLRAYYIYSFIICILTSVMGIASAIYGCIGLFLFKIGEIDLTFHIWIILVDTASFLAQVLGQVYVLLLVRSEIIKLRSHCEFRFVNNAAEAECTLKCEEMNGEGRPEYTYERYAPELYNINDRS